MSTTRMVRLLKAPREKVYRALTEGASVAKWMFPDGMAIEVHQFEPRVGGSFRISLTYANPESEGKSSVSTDTYHGRFVELVPNERVVQVSEFETSNPSMQGEMTITFTLTNSDGGTLLTAVHENVPPGVAPSDNELGWTMALDKLAKLVES